ncbi:MAG TPA: glycosyltransferase family 2 protein [Gemmatimonadaceae bacterium]
MLSIVVPVFDEEASVRPLVEAVGAAMHGWRDDWELIFVDDGSGDATAATIERVSSEESRVRLVKLARNYGQSAAMQAGFDHARGDVIVTMDGDLQNDPADIPALHDLLISGYDLVAGYRVRRQDPWLTRRLPSLVANAMVRAASGLSLRDTGCTLKAFRRELLGSLRLYSELHRFIPALAASGAGARIIEVPVRHHARRYGRSKYGLSRVGRVLADLLTLFMLRRFGESPLRMFARGSLLSFGIGFLATMVALAAAFDFLESVSMVVFSVIACCWLALSGFLLMAGLIAETFVHTDEEGQHVGRKFLYPVSG